MKARRPIIIGIVGDSAAGKTTISRGLEQILGPDRVTHVCTDDYHKYDRRERAKLGITALHPDCNFLDIMELQLERLHYGQPILKPVYDHSTGSLVRPEYVQPKEFIIVEGLLGFYTEAMRPFYDVKVYLDPPEDLRKVWKIKRDTTKRGYSAEEVLKEWEKRRDDSTTFIRPQRAHADIVVSFFPAEGARLEDAGPNLNVRLVLRPTIPHPDLTYLLENNGADSPGVRLVLGRDAGRPVDFLEIEGKVSQEHAHKLEDAIWAHLPDLRPVGDDLVGSYQDRTEVRHSHPLALTQLLLIYHLLRKYSDGQIPYAPPLAALTRIRGGHGGDPTADGV
ncbi:MAG: phosphoribulokinase [Acidobacteria bacterium]|nr:phosphoribulokinase [Acidobacteriota bacterium]MCG3192548.1 Uridine kinase [Thermoanaerobaculia bacterium]MCK6681720.1 phosphoribulokinase [Thermoanaerobaculia bacterium]